MSQDTVYISAAETGLVKWDEFRKPPYSEQDYLDAYNNGQRMTQAFMTANANGASKVVLERGNYPLCYVNDLKTIAKLTHNNLITGTTDLTIDGNGSCTFTIFDSVNRSPYHTGEGAAILAPYQLSGSQFWLEHNTNLTIKGFNLRGDQYNRSWVTGEKEIEQTYGISLGINNINTKIDVVAHGFRGDAVTGKDSMLGVYSLTDGHNGGDWLKGGLSTSDGSEVVEVGAYRTRVMDIREKTIYRNAVQLMTTGNATAIRNREDAMQAFFYDENNVLISTELVWQAEFIYLPVDCAFIRIVAYGDERTDETVGYGVYVYLYTGCSNHAEIKGEYFANHRGAVSNLCNNTIVDADIHDNGTTKYGFPTYSSTTRYGVNFEDDYYNKLTVRGSIRNGGSAILCNARRLDVDCDIKNMLYSAIGTFGTKEVNILGGVIANVPSVLDITPEVGYKLNRFVKMKNLIIRNSPLYGNYSTSENLTLDISGNTFDKGAVNLRGDGRNLVFTNNQIINPTHSGSGSTILIAGALNSHDNSVIVGSSSAIIDNRAIAFMGENSHSNLMYFDRINPVYITGAVSGQVTTLKGLDIESASSRNMIALLSKSTAAEGEVFKTVIDNCNFRNGNILIGNYSNVDLCNSNTIIQNCTFSQSENTLTHFIDLSIRGTLGTGSHQLHFKNCTFNLTDITKHIMYLPFGLSGTIDIIFSDCTFSADTPKTERLKIFNGRPVLTNITARALDCRFINVNP